VIVVAGRRAGLSGTRIGLLYGLFAAFLLLGSAISPWCRRRLSMTAIVLIELWLTVATVLFVLWPNVYVLTLAILPQAASMPVTDSAIVGYRIAITPDRLLGRSEGVRATLGLTIAPIGPLLAGILLARTSPRATVAVFAAGSVALAIWATLNRSLRDAPALAELDR
jgi:MFS family permease